MSPEKSTVRLVLEPFAIALVLAVVVRAIVQIYAIPSASMAPTLAPGDRILVTRYFSRTPQRGDVVVFLSPLAPGELLVKRVVGLPGELIETGGGGVRVAWHSLAEPYVRQRGAATAAPAQIVPTGSYFVLGDNRADSSDSRNWGAVPREMIVGRARLILWSRPLRPASDNLARAAGSHPGRRADGSSERSDSRRFKWIE